MEQKIALELFRYMVQSRFLDDKCKTLLESGVYVPNFHSGTGQEATSVGSAACLEKSDYYFYTHRDYAGLLAKGVSLREVIGDLMVRKSGTNKGFGSIMHTVAPELGILGRNGVFGSRFGIAAGVALASKIRNKHDAVLCAYGEAEGSRGPLYEALNFSVLNELPLIFLAENNGFSISARTNDLYAGGNMSDLLKGFKIPNVSINGNDILEVYNTVREMRSLVIDRRTPAVIECVTYRVDSHIPTDQGKYRSDEEVQGWRTRDPIALFEHNLSNEFGISSDTLEKIKVDTRKNIEEEFENVMKEDSATLKEMSGYVYYGGKAR